MAFASRGYGTKLFRQRWSLSEVLARSRFESRALRVASNIMVSFAFGSTMLPSFIVVLFKLFAVSRQPVSLLK